jgi:hypothetical protein
MTKPRGKGKPFQKGEDPRRIHGRQDEQVNEFAREMKKCLLDAAEETGNRMAAISNARLPKQPNKKFTKELIELLRQDPKGMTSYFNWLAEHHPALCCARGAAAMRTRDRDDPTKFTTAPPRISKRSSGPATYRCCKKVFAAQGIDLKPLI